MALLKKKKKMKRVSPARASVRVSLPDYAQRIPLCSVAYGEGSIRETGGKAYFIPCISSYHIITAEGAIAAVDASEGKFRRLFLIDPGQPLDGMRFRLEFSMKHREWEIHREL